MARKTIEKEEVAEEDQIESLLGSKEFKGLHFGSRSGEEIVKADVISTGSFFFDEVLGGGFRSSMWARFYAESESGKTSMALCWGKQWQDKYPDDGVVVFFNAEGRLGIDLIERSGICTDKSRFRIIDTNYSDLIWSMIEKLTHDNEENKRYFFVVDSTDACVRIQDGMANKNIGDAEKIGGSATILSAAGKRLSLLFNRKNHFLFMCSQVRDKLNTMHPGAGGKDASGGNAPKFYSSLTGEIKKSWSGTLLYEDPSDQKSKVIGRMVEIKLHKTFNEKTGQTISYPVKYGHKGGVWKAYEALLLAQAWGFIKQKGAWFNLDEDFYQQLQAKGIDVDDKYQGLKGLRNFFDETPAIVDFVLSKIKSLIS